MKTNSKEVRVQVQKHILECVTGLEGELFTNITDAKKHIIERYESEFNHQYNKVNYPNNQERFKNYLLGLPFSFEFYYDTIKETLNTWGLFKEKATDEQSADLYYYLIFKEVFK